MCKICLAICKEIETTFGHKVTVKDLENLIENSPVIDASKNNFKRYKEIE